MQDPEIYEGAVCSKKVSRNPMHLDSYTSKMTLVNGMLLPHCQDISITCVGIRQDASSASLRENMELTSNELRTILVRAMNLSLTEQM